MSSVSLCLYYGTFRHKMPAMRSRDLQLGKEHVEDQLPETIAAEQHTTPRDVPLTKYGCPQEEMASERKAKADLRTFLAANEVNLAIKAAAKEQQQKARLFHHSAS